MGSVRAFLFDLGGVVVQLGFEQAVQEFLQRCRVPRPSIEAFLWTAPATLAFEQGHLTPRAYFTDLQRSLQFDGDYEAFCRLWNSWVSEQPQMVSLIAALKERYTIGILSNTNVIHLRCLMDRCTFLRSVDRCIASCLIGARKPQPRIYEIAIAQMGLPAQEIIYVDDRAECVEGGARVGLQAIQFTGYGALVEHLRAVGVTWNSHHDSSLRSLPCV